MGADGLRVFMVTLRQQLAVAHRFFYKQDDAFEIMCRQDRMNS